MSSSTAFVGIDERPAAQSFMPCHLFGDANIFGLGIRLGFYLQYAAVVVALFFGQTKWLRNVRTGLAILAIAMLVTLCVNSTSGRSLVFLDWYILIALTLGYVFLTDVFLRGTSLYVSMTQRRNQRAIARARSELQSGAGQGDRDDQVALLEAGTAVYKANFLIRDVEGSNRRLQRGALSELRNALSDFALAADDSEAGRAYDAERIYQLTGSCRSFDADGFRRDLLRAATEHGLSHQEADRLDERARELALLQAKSASHEQTISEIEKDVQAYEPLDRLAIATICLSWAAYQFARPWLYWFAINDGAKTGCDLRVMWFFIPISIYNKAFGIWLKIWGILLVLGGIAAVVYGIWLLIFNLFAISRWSRTRYQEGEVEAQRELLATEQRRVSRDSSRSSSSSERSREDRESEHQDGEKRPAKTAKRKKKIYTIVACFQLFRLIVTIGAVEGSIGLNKFDMTAPPFGTASQLIAFLVGLLTSVPVYWECLVIVPLRWLRHRRRQQRRRDVRAEEGVVSKEA